MYGPEVTLPMFDDGVHGEGVAGDGIFGAWIPAAVASDGQMIRYFVSASDVHTNLTRWPLFSTPFATAEYIGTVVNPNYVTSRIPIFQLFIDQVNQGAADSQSGSRCSVFWDGEFYDNIE